MDWMEDDVRQGRSRGGSRGCVPHGDTSFQIGCTVSYGIETFELDVVIQVDPELRIIYERLQGPAPALESGNVEQRDLVIARNPKKGATFIEAEVFNGKLGHNPTVTFRDTRLLTSQLSARLIPKNRADRAVLRGAEAITAALRGAFHLDPVPHLMREYVPERDADLRRTGQNLSAAIGRLGAVCKLHSLLIMGGSVRVWRLIGLGSGWRWLPGWRFCCRG